MGMVETITGLMMPYKFPVSLGFLESGPVGGAGFVGVQPVGSHWAPTQKGPVLSLMLSFPMLRPSVAPLKFLIFEQGTPIFILPWFP